MGVYEELVERGLIAQVTDEEQIRDLVNNGKAVFYIGFDPTADSLHVVNEATHLVIIAVKLVVSASATVVKLGEAVDIYAVALLALVQLQQAALAHGGPELVLSDGEVLVLYVVTLLVVVQHQLVGCDLAGQDVIGNPLVEQVVGRGVG